MLGQCVCSSPLIKATVFSFCFWCLCILCIRDIETHYSQSPNTEAVSSQHPSPQACTQSAQTKNTFALTQHIHQFAIFQCGVGWHVFIAEDHFQTHRSWEPTLVSLALLTQTLMRIINSGVLQKTSQKRRKHCKSLTANNIDVKVGWNTPALLLGVVCCVVQSFKPSTILQHHLCRLCSMFKYILITDVNNACQCLATLPRLFNIYLNYVFI